MADKMRRLINRLNARRVTAETKPGRHADGGNLYLVVDPSGAKRWVFLFRWQGKLKEMGLGGLTSVSLARAREKAAAARALLDAGRNPITARKDEQAVPTFGEAADVYVAAHEASWKNDKHKAQWRTTLKDHAASLRPLLVDEIDTAAVLAVLQPIWTKKPETASRLRGRIEAILDAAKAAGHRSGENPAAWRGHLDHLLPGRQKLSRGHFAAMPYGDIPAFIAALRAQDTVSALALEFLILTAARSGEVLGATWPEIDFKARVWAIPAERTKASREHRVPLSERAVEVLREAEKLRAGGHVFPGRLRDRPLSSMALEMTLRRMKVENATPHGFRSAFRDWAGNETHYPREICEAALAHAVGDRTEQAYRRSDALERRRALMTDWAAFIEPREDTANVVDMRQRRGKPSGAGSAET